MYFISFYYVAVTLIVLHKFKKNKEIKEPDFSY